MPHNKEIKFEQPSILLLLVNKNITFIIIAIVVFILLGGYFFLFLPKIENIKLIQKDNTASENRQDRNKKILDNVALLKNKYLEIKTEREEQLASLKKLIPDDPQVAELFLMLEKISKDNNFNLNSISVTGGEQDSDTDEIKTESIVISVTYTPPELDDNEEVSDTNVVNENNAISEDTPLDTVSAEEILPPYDAFKQYIAALEDNLRLMDISTVSFGSLPVDSGGVSFNFTINTYFR